MAKGYDWDRIEADYRTGKYTTRELSTLHGPDHSAIAKRAKKEGWQQDLSTLISRMTKEKLAEAAVESVATELHGISTERAAAVAAINVGVIESHRTGLGKLKGVVESLAEELAGATRAAQKFEPEEIISLAEAKGLHPTEVGRMLEMVQVASRANVADKLAAAYAKLVPLERKAHGLDADGGDKNTFDEWVREQGL
jgi:hypothetical protein